MGLEQTVAASTIGTAANSVANVVMYADESNQFEELLLRGVEIDLMLFEILVRVLCCALSPCLSALESYLDT